MQTNLKSYSEWSLVLVTIIAAGGWVFTKEAIVEFPPLGFLGIRFSVAAIILIPFCWNSLKKIKRKNLLQACSAGGLLTLNLVTWVLALSLNGALGEGSFIMSLAVLIVPLFAWLIFKDKPLKIFWLSLPIATIGLACLTINNGWHITISQAWFLFSATAFAIYFIFTSRYVRNIPILVLTCIQLLIAGIISIAFSTVFETWPSYISWDAIWWLMASILIATCLRYVFQLMGQKYVSVGNAAIIMILEPVFTTIVGLLVYHEPMTFMKWLGCFLILIALLIYRGYIFILARK